MKRVVLAFLTAPFPVALFQSLVVWIWPRKGFGIFEHPASMFVLLCLLFYVLEIFLALPLYFARRRRLPSRGITYGVVGAIIALVPIVCVLAFAAFEAGLRALPAHSIVYNIALFGAGGFAAGIVFWRVTKAPADNEDLGHIFA
jgi:hypothetical protein